MTLFTSSSWSLFCGASSVRGCDICTEQLHLMLRQVPFINVMVQLNRELLSPFTVNQARNDLCFISLHSMNLKLKKNHPKRNCLHLLSASFTEIIEAAAEFQISIFCAKSWPMQTGCAEGSCIFPSDTVVKGQSMSNVPCGKSVQEKKRHTFIDS